MLSDGRGGNSGSCLGLGDCLGCNACGLGGGGKHGPVAVRRGHVTLTLLFIAASLAVHVFTFGYVRALQQQLEAAKSGAAGVGAPPPVAAQQIPATPQQLTPQQIAALYHTQAPPQPIAMAPAPAPVYAPPPQPVVQYTPPAPAPAPVPVYAPPPVAAPAPAPVPAPMPAAVPVALPPVPAPVTLTQAQLTRFDDAWRWFETSAEHKDLIAKVQALRKERGRPLVILDVGLNVGSAPYALERVCPDCVIHGFEPIPQYYTYAASKLGDRQRYPNVVLHNYALCDRVGATTIWMDTSGANLGWNTLIASQKTSSQQEVPITCVTLDALMAAGAVKLPGSGLPVTTIDLIKIDTEGAEHMVLRGMAQTIRAHRRPKPWFYIEVGWGVDRRDWPEEVDTFQRVLFADGYETYDMSKIRGTSMHWITPLPA